MNPMVANLLQAEKVSEYLTIHDLVEAASNVIVPLGPIQAFAARSPWANLEQKTFEQVARRLKDVADVDIYPNESMIAAARNRGEIRLDLLQMRVRRWLDSQAIDLPRKVVEQYCLAALTKEQSNADLFNTSELQSLAKKLSRFSSITPNKQTVRTVSQRLTQLSDNREEKKLNRHLIKWCKLYLGESQAVWMMPNREKGFYQAWRSLIEFDPALNHDVRKQFKDWPEDAEQALEESLSLLEIPYSDTQEYLEAHLLALPGWAGMMKWRTQEATGEQSLLTEYLAVRVSMEWAFVNSYLPVPPQEKDTVQLESLVASWAYWGNLPLDAWAPLSVSERKARLTLAYRFDEMVRRKLWLEAWEETYENQLKNQFTCKQPAIEMAKVPTAQFAFCIDVRSELFRRKLEQAGPFETFGTAGFFGLPIETNELGCKHNHSSLPVMFQPKYKVKEAASASAMQQYQERGQAVHSLSNSFLTLKHNLMASLLLPEVSGPWLSLQTLARSFVPRSTGYAFRKFRKSWLRKPTTELSLGRMHTSETELPVGFSDEEQVYYAHNALKMMGLTDHFAPVVVICGHGSHSTNNPYASSLDCGACGGASSGFNARVLAALCNLPNVRKSLAADGIIIPKDTVFAAAEHITSVDELRWLYVPELSEAAEEAFAAIQTALPKVSEKASIERLEQLPNISSTYKNPKEEVYRHAEDWSEIRPEWGLANNATFIIGDRKLTKDTSLEGRAFLHNYNWKNDKNGTILSGIIAGPAKVAQWINLQYYSSTVAPHYYGSGNKATQTVTGGIGVMQGNASDLLSGLSWQSVMQSDQEAYHTPIRLLVVIQAPKEYVKRLLEQDQAFHQKVRNGWLRLASIDPEGNWESWSS